MRHAHVHITGIVQGVGFRPFVYRLARTCGVGGWVLNAGDGVHVEVHGPDEDVAAFAEGLSCEAPAAARIDGIELHELEAGSWDAADEQGFRIIASDEGAARTTLVSPDIATCPDCVRELFDPADRRYHYPFINCTNCGPRFTIIHALPYDRKTTSMEPFCMCPACAAEYANPANRRFHAQPDACFECGPHLTWRERGGSAAEAADAATGAVSEAAGVARATAKARGASPNSTGMQEPTNQRPEKQISVGSDLAKSDAIIGRCVDLLEQGGIVAIKGLGGFHLACDASNEKAVAELRRRKRRSNKPLAVMVRDIEAARSICTIGNTEEGLLCGSVRPIVLLQRSRACVKGDAVVLAPNVAFDLPEVGVMLPYTPLQHLLLAACAERGVRALVMTSGNISEEPIEIDDALAWEKLVESGIADALLGNDRAILSRFDDSVVRVVDGTVMPVRRARGYAPQPLALPTLSSVSTNAATESKAQGAKAPSGLSGNPANAPAQARAQGSLAFSGTSDVPASSPAILACGPEQKAALAFTRENSDGSALCFASQHIGDVENGSTFDAWNNTRERFAELFDLQATALVCDLHPSYLPSQWAREHARTTGLPLAEVQHHHAHAASVIAEAAAEGLINAEEQVICLVFDGTGAGGVYDETGALVLDGSIWGGEFLVASLASFERVAHLPSWCLPGGAASVKDARRNAYALLHEFGLLEHSGAQALVDSLSEQERTITRTMVERGINSPRTTSMGRLFDAAAAILGICPTATYEGEPAIRLEAAAWHAIAAGYDSAEAFFAQAGQNLGSLPRYAKGAEASAAEASLADAIPGLIERLLDQIGAQNPVSPTFAEPEATPNEAGFRISGKTAYLAENERENLPAATDMKSCTLALQFHLGIAQAAVNTARQIHEQTGIGTVALSGGVFMNRLLLQLIKKGLEQQGFKVLVPHTVPVNDGCISYGQAAIARARLTMK